VTDQPLILHCRIPKNAGGSIDLCLVEAFAERWRAAPTLLTHGMTEAAAQAPHDWARDESVVAATSWSPPWHWVRTGGRPIAPFAMIRHPLDRAASFYAHRRHLGDERLVGLSPSQFIDALLLPHHVPALRSFQVRYLSDDPAAIVPSAPDVTAEQFTTAVARLRTLPFGLVDRFDASLPQLHAALRPIDPQFTLRPHHINWSGGPLVLSQRLKEFASALEEDRHRHLVRANQADLELYELAVSRLAERAAGLDG
jgi:hypothetical protein